ncbi:MAG: hypothetical protein ABL918_13245 [Chakrabartia sp.]
MLPDWGAVGAIAGIAGVIIAAWQLVRMHNKTSEVQVVQIVPDAFPLQIATSNLSIPVRQLSFRMETGSAELDSNALKMVNQFATFSTVHSSIIYLENEEKEIISGVNLHLKFWGSIFGMEVCETSTLAKESVRITSNDSAVQIFIDHLPPDEEVKIVVFSVGMSPANDLRSGNGQIRLMRKKL